MKTPTIGQIVWFYGDHQHARGMKSRDDRTPFAAIVAWPLSERLANLLVIDHNATTFACAAVPVFQGDDKDDHKAPCHCELEAPAIKEPIALTGVAGVPIVLNLEAGIAPGGEDSNGPASVALTFTVPAGNTYTFASAKTGISQAFQAGPVPQVLTLTTAQIAGGALADLSLTAAIAGDVSLAVAVTEQAANGALGLHYTFTETIAVAPVASPVEAEPEPAKPAAPFKPVMASNSQPASPAA